jgi:hypothetical protein
MPELIPGCTVSLSPLIKRVLAPNPAVMPGSGTNTYPGAKHSLFAHLIKLERENRVKQSEGHWH